MEEGQRLSHETSGSVRLVLILVVMEEGQRPNFADAARQMCDAS